MNKLSRSRTAQLIFQSMFCTLALIACVGSVGFFDMKFSSDFYIYFTNLSCYIATGMMIFELVQTARKKEDSYVSAAPHLHFMIMLGLIITFIVFNALLANDPARDPALNYKVECILCHIVLPILFVIDWAVFYEHGTMDWKLPLLTPLFPLGYVVYVFIHAALRGFDSSIMNYAGTDPVIYPYFFLNPEKVGIGGMALWIFGLLVAIPCMAAYAYFRRRASKLVGQLELASAEIVTAIAARRRA